MLLIAGNPIGRTHDADIRLATGAIVIAHLDRCAESAPFRPVQRCLQRCYLVVRVVAEQRAIIHALRMHYLARIEQARRIETGLDLFEGAQHSCAEHTLMKFRTRQAVSVFAGMRAFVLFNNFQRFFHDGAHFLRPAGIFHIENRAYMQTTDRGMGVPGAGGAVFFEHPRQSVGILCKIFQLYRTILDEGYWFTVTLHRHHDVEAGLAHFPNRGLEIGIERLDYRIGEAEIGHQFDQLSEFTQLFAAIVTSELDQ